MNQTQTKGFASCLTCLLVIRGFVFAHGVLDRGKLMIVDVGSDAALGPLQ